jgi:hypothetical protein
MRFHYRHPILTGRKVEIEAPLWADSVEKLSAFSASV